MENKKKRDDEISIYIEDKEYMANNYVMKCFAVTMLVFFVCFLLNLMGIFIIKQSLMIKCCIPLFIVYSIMYIVSKKVSLSNKYMKYYILLSIVIAISIGEIFITYQVLLVTLLPFLYATIYSSKKVIRYVFILKVISTIIVVYTGYYFGLCDANMVLLTTNNMSDYVVNGQFVLTEINSNPIVNLFVFFIMPRCFIYLAYMSVSGSILKIVSGSVEKAKITKELEKAKIEAEKLKEEAEKASMAKSKFLARMSHEIRTPINAIMGMNEMIIRENKDEIIEEYAYDVKESSKMLLDIVNDILDSSKIESGMMELLPVEYKITSVINDIYNMTIFKAKDKGLELEFDIIFMDHMMPGMDGVETLHRIKTDMLCVDTPVIMLTANAIVGDRERFLKEGFDGFLSKPIQVDKLENLIEKYLKEKDLIDKKNAVAVKNVTKEYIQNVPDIKYDNIQKEINEKEDIWRALEKRLPEIDFNMGMTTCSGDKEFYMEIFKDFVKLKVKEELAGLISINDYKNYCIRIHGFKNNAYSIGAKELGDLAYEMEKLTREGLSSEINVMQENLFKKYDRICSEFKSLTM